MGCFAQLAAGEPSEELTFNGWPLYLYGDTGVGKTCAALWLMDQVPDSAYVTQYAFRRNVYAQDAWIWDIAKTSRLVVIDEVGTVSQSEDGWTWAREKEAVKRFADLRDVKPTVWLSNKSPDELRELYDDRIHSRLCSGTVVLLTGPDHRFED
jgi:chromosomal replication initiation ATPase DnaA